MNLNVCFTRFFILTIQLLTLATVGRGQTMLIYDDFGEHNLFIPHHLPIAKDRGNYNFNSNYIFQKVSHKMCVGIVRLIYDKSLITNRRFAE